MAETGKDKYAAIWVSHSSISDFLKCPRAYFLKNVYRDPKTGHKIRLISPPLSLGQVVHSLVESLSILPVDQRLTNVLMEKFDRSWQKITGKKGGFFDRDVEEEYKRRGRKMLQRIIKNPGPIEKLAVKINMDLPYFWLSEKDNIILCGKIDWLEYFPETDGVRILDFKTGKIEESLDSLQLPIYLLLAENCQKHSVQGAAYWYLEKKDQPDEQTLPDSKESYKRVLKVAKEIKLARQLARFKCPHKDGCFACKPFEAILKGKAEFVGLDEYKGDVYVLNSSLDEGKAESTIL